MLRITMNKSASGAKKYFSEEYYYEGVSNQLNYYTDKNQLIGKWGGKAAEKLGLQGDIHKDDFSDLCDNINPETGKTLTGRNDTDRTVGYDFTFNASKSVSLACTFGNDKDKKDILNAFRDSVTDTMNEIETGMQARVRDKGKNENRETGNIAYGEFIHFTTRPVDGLPDPHLHAHCFVFNATYDEQDNKWKAGQFRQTKQDAPYYEACFHSTLADKLEKIGYNIERTKNGFEIAGLEKDTLEKFSRRTKEIEEYAKDNNITDDKQKSQIGAKTREAKRTNVTAEHEFTEWENRLTPDEQYKLNNLKSNPGGANDNRPLASPEVAKEALNYSLDHHLERRSVATDKEVLATAIKSSIGTATPEQVKKGFYENKDILAIKENNRTFITTKEALAEEKQLIINANSFRGKFRPINENYKPRSDLLNDQQHKAIQYALNNTDGISIISGKAGTGKTTLMREVKHGINATGKQIFAYAPSSEASRVVQRSEGFENADTLASLIQNKSRHQELKNQVIWIDEAGMVSNKDMNHVLAIAKEQNARVILSGDTRQHNSVERGDALRIMQKYSGIASITVDKIQRQKNSDYRQAVKFLSEANTEKGFKKLESIGAITEIADNKERIKAVAEDYYSSSFKGKSRQNVLVIAPTHSEGELVTNEIRNKLKEKNHIANDNREFTVLKNLQYTEAQKLNTENYRQGNILAFHQNIKGIRAGTKLEVLKTADNNIIAKDKSGTEYTIPVSKARNFNVFESRKIEISTGDKIRITGNGKDTKGKHLFNGTTYNIAGFDKQGNIKLSNGSMLPANYGHWNFGYVMTSHASQGKTTDKIIISQSSLSGRASSIEQFYVSVSRGKQAVSIYTDDKAELMQAVSHSTQRVSATELFARNDNIRAVIEHGRLAAIKKMKDKAKDKMREAIEKLKPSNNKAHELPGTDREAPGKSR
jgi:conjugative relaxase-like TrwC/TraI family protein